MRKLIVGLSVSVIVMSGLWIGTSCGPECVNIIPSNHSEKPTIEMHYIHATSATILSLTVFGSVLGLRVVANPTTIKLQTRGLAAILAGVIVLVIIHVHVMIFTCCVTWTLTQSTYTCLLVLTMWSMFLLLIGFAALFDAQIRITKEARERMSSVNGDQEEYPT